jgi:transcriptional antiterminator NusG
MSAREDGLEAGVEDRMEQTGAAQDVAAMEGERPPEAVEAEAREQAASEEATPEVEPMPAAKNDAATEPAHPGVEDAPADESAAGQVMQAAPEPEPIEDEAEPAEEPEPEPLEATTESEPTEEPEPEPAEEPEPDPMEAEAVLAEEPEAEPAEAELELEEEFEPEPLEAMAEPKPAEEPEAVPRLEEPEDGRQWYVVHCYSGYENKVRHNLEQRIETMNMKDKIFDVVVPTEEEMEVKDGKRRTVERRVFPGYILVQMLMDEDSWYVVRNTPGVTGFVGMGNEPTPLRPEEVAQIVKRMEAEAPRIKVTYKTGQKVRIIDGPFNDFIGTVDNIDMDKAKVRVMVSFFGRETPVELDFLQVEKA